MVTLGKAPQLPLPPRQDAPGTTGARNETHWALEEGGLSALWCVTLDCLGKGRWVSLQPADVGLLTAAHSQSSAVRQVGSASPRPGRPLSLWQSRGSRKKPRLRVSWAWVPPLVHCPVRMSPRALLSKRWHQGGAHFRGMGCCDDGGLTCRLGSWGSVCWVVGIWPATL